MERTYMCIDLKSFFASVECRERGLNPITTNLVVADKSRTEKTVCLAVTPALKEYGISGRARLFEVIQKVKAVNAGRRLEAPNNKFTGKSYNADELKSNKELELDYIVATPRMGMYMKYSTQIYNIYLKYISSEDMFPYSIDEVFFDVTKYLKYYKLSARDLATKIIHDVFDSTGITATAGIGTNLYLAKIAMDVWAKHVKPDKNGVRIAELDESSYRKLLWNHRPITDFWRVGAGYARKLEQHRIYTMGDVALCSIGKENEYYNEDLLYKLFGINAELLIDHAWGWEPCTIEDVKKHKPAKNSISSGQVLYSPYDYDKTKLIVKEMADGLALDLVKKHLVTKQIVLTIGYDTINLKDKDKAMMYKGEVSIDRYGREVPKHAHGTVNLEDYTSSTKKIKDAAIELYERIMNKNLMARRINIVASNVIKEDEIDKEQNYEQMDLFASIQKSEEENTVEKEKKKYETELQRAMLEIKKKYGKNAILRGMNFEEGGTAIERNRQIGGHKE